ncbi:hypothetical protein ACNI3K_00430 [Demequina sp. SO4-13]|uniref:hypothetical protein n=1 Tax=Demequina sp. SO4-13 TaxID=3401027 RepID=UPI003AF485A1
MLRVVENVRQGAQAEDDACELKRDWPSLKKVRQLAGAANRSNGAELIYVIGIDETDGSLHQTSGLDAADWWAGMQAKFDQVAPELVQHVVVNVDEEHVVVALQFTTDRAPYVVKTDGGSPEFEVPIREGSRTRSAHRHEVIRMLQNVAQVPQMTFASAQGTMVWQPAMDQSQAAWDSWPEHCNAEFTFEIFFQSHYDSIAFLPWHLATARLDAANVSLPLTLAPRPSNKPRAMEPQGIHLRHDGIAVAGSGVAGLVANGGQIDPAYRNIFEKVESLRITVEFVASVHGPKVSVSAHLARSQSAVKASFGGQGLGRFVLN